MKENTNEETFKKDFMQKIYGSYRGLNKFLISNFYIDPDKLGWRKIMMKMKLRKKRSKQEEVEENIAFLNSLTDGQKRVAKAKLKQLEENNDVSKIFPSIIAITAALLVVINTISRWIIKGADLKISDQKERIKESGNSLMNFDSLAILKEELGLMLSTFLIAIVLIIYLTYKLSKNSNHRSTTIYINSLLEDVLTIKEQELESSPEVNNNESKNPQFINFTFKNNL